MRRQAVQFLAIAGQTARETIRGSAILLVASACVVLNAVLPMTVSHTLGESGRMMADTSLAVHLLAGLLMSGLAACHALTGEMRGGTAASILSKPVSPAVFYLAKYAGLAVALLLFSILATAAGLLGARAAAEDYTFDGWAALPLLLAPVAASFFAGLYNFFTRRPFVSAAFFLLLLCTGAAFLIGASLDQEGHRMAFGSLYFWPLAQAHLLVAMAILLWAALALALAVRWQTVAVGALSGSLFFLGLLSDYLFGRHAATHRGAAFLYRVVPNMQIFWAIDTLHAEKTLPAAYLIEVSLYSFFLLLALLGFGLALFRHTEVRT